MRYYWTEETVNRKADSEGIRPQEWVEARRKEFESNTGVKWGAASQHGGYAFHPIDDGMPVMHPVPRDTAQKIRIAYEAIGKDSTGYVSYLQVYEHTGWDLKGLMAAIKGMERDGQARRTVDRMGKGYAFKLLV